MSLRAWVAALLLGVAAAVFVGDVAWRAAGPASEGWAEGAARDAGLPVDIVASTLLSLHHADASSGVIVEVGQDADEAQAVLAFVGRGGRTLVLGDEATADLLGAPLSSASVSDLPEGVRAELVLDADARDVLVDGRPVLRSPEGALPLLTTTRDAFIDVDEDGRATTTDVPGPFTMGLALHGGRAIVLGVQTLDRDAWRAMVRAHFQGAPLVFVEGDSRAGPFAAAALDVAHRPTVTAATLLPTLAAASLLAWPRRASRRGGAAGDAPFLPEADG